MFNNFLWSVYWTSLNTRTATYWLATQSRNQPWKYRGNTIIQFAFYLSVLSIWCCSIFFAFSFIPFSSSFYAPFLMVGFFSFISKKTISVFSLMFSILHPLLKIPPPFPKKNRFTCLSFARFNSLHKVRPFTKREDISLSIFSVHHGNNCSKNSCVSYWSEKATRAVCVCVLLLLCRCYNGIAHCIKRKSRRSAAKCDRSVSKVLFHCGYRLYIHTHLLYWTVGANVI